MRNVKIFAGRSHPDLSRAIAQKLGMQLAACNLGYFQNGETSVQIGTSIRNQDVFIIQSGSTQMNDSVMELLIMVNACKGGSAKSITAVVPYFPYSRQSKKKSHRGAITAKMLANLLVVAGVDHVITVDLHATQMQGFFGKPVDNLFAEPLLVRWIRAHVPDWAKSVAVSKNAGGTKRVTALADALKLSFAIVSTDRSRQLQQPPTLTDSTIFFDSSEPQTLPTRAAEATDGAEHEGDDANHDASHVHPASDAASSPPRTHRGRSQIHGVAGSGPARTAVATSSPLTQTTRMESASPSASPHHLGRPDAVPLNARRPSEYEAMEGYTDERARDVITSRLVHGHVVDDDEPSPALSALSSSMPTLPGERQLRDAMDGAAFDPMAASFVSTVSDFQQDHALGGTFDAAASSDDEDKDIKDPAIEHIVTLVGNVKDRTVLVVDDMIDKSASWIAAAETCVKRGGARQVYCIATHALFGDESLEEMEQCDCINYIVVTNTFPISAARLRESRKLVVIDVSNLLAEAIRRNHHGESISALFHTRV